MFLAIRNADHTLTNRPHRGARPGYLVQGDRNGFKLRKSLWGLSEPEQERFVAALYAMMDPEASPDTACSEYCRLAGLYDYPGSGTTTNPQCASRNPRIGASPGGAPAAAVPGRGPGLALGRSR